MPDDRPAPGELLRLVLAAAAGSAPPVDGLVEVVPAPTGALAAIVAFTGHHVVAADVPADWVAVQCRPWDLEAPFGPSFVAALAGRVAGRAGSLDLVFVAAAGTAGRRDLPAADGAGSAAAGPAGPASYLSIDLEPLRGAPASEWLRSSPHPRRDNRVYRTPDGHGRVAVGRGLGGRWEISFGVAEKARGRGIGRRLAAAACQLVEPGEFLFAQVAPGNVASVRAVLAAGFRPIAAEILFQPLTAPTSA